MNNEQIHHMVNRFLSWKLPEDFRPDGGVTFTPSYTDEPMRSRHWPIGTNILSALQASLMVRHMLEDLPNAEEAQALAETAADEHVRQLVIAAREAWEDATDAKALERLDKALEPFGEVVPYENEPDRKAEIAAALDNPQGTVIDAWHCGNNKLQQQFAMAMMVAKDAPMRDLDDLEYLAMQCGPEFTRHAIRRLLPNAPAQEDLDSEIPF